MTKLLNYLWRIWFLIIVIIATILCGLLVYPLSFNPKTFRACYFFMRIWCIILFYGMGFRYELTSPTERLLILKRNMCLFQIIPLLWILCSCLYYTPSIRYVLSEKGIGEDSHIWHYL